MLSYSDVHAARLLIEPHIRNTPLVELAQINKLAGCELLLKLENFQSMGAFKIRGASHFVLTHLKQAKSKGVIAASAGNHSQGVAAICYALKVPATILMPQHTPTVKIQNTKQWGAKVELFGDNLDASLAEAERLSKDKGMLLAHAFGDPTIMAGHGTLALELLEHQAFEKATAVVIPVGGGGLMSGCIAALREKRPKLKIYGVSSQMAPESWALYHKREVPKGIGRYTIAEGVAIKKPLPQVSEYLNQNLDDFFCIGEEAIAYAISLLAEHGKVVVEGAGALPLAAVLDGQIKDDNVCLVLSGGNIDPALLSRVLQRGLVEQGRLARLRIQGPDRPGMLNGITHVLSEMQANVVQVSHTRGVLNIGVGDTLIEVDIETKAPEHTDDIISRLEENALQVHRVY